MFQIRQSEKIKSPQKVVWDVITHTEDYPDWNKFVVACDSTFEVGSAIKMKVRVLPFITLPQNETIFQNEEGTFLEYGIKIPGGILSSSRQHILTATGLNTTLYESVFILKGFLAPLVGYLLGSQLQRGFSDMTHGVAKRSLDVYTNKVV
jgi:hypothetical protein